MNTLQLPADKKRNVVRFYQLTCTLAIGTGIFSAVVCLMLALNFWHFKSQDPIHSLQMPKLIEQIQQGNNDAEFLASVRAYDLLIRKAHFTALAFNQFGGYLLLGGLSLCLLFTKLAYELNRKLPQPEKIQTIEDQPQKIHRIQYTIFSLALLSVLLAFILPRFFSKPWLLPTALTSAPQTSMLSDLQTCKKNWPTFRGFQSLGLAYSQQPPLDWDATNHENIRWKIKLPKPGFNSPIVWENRIFLSGADAMAREIYCFDLSTGKLLWKRNTTLKSGIILPEVPEDTGLCASTMSTDGRSVSAIFATGELLTCDLKGTLLWEKKLPLPDNHYGHASSLITYQGLLLVQYDQGQVGKIMALDSYTGKLQWEQTRAVETSWASPILAPASTGDQLILTSTPLIIAYHPMTGATLWQMEELIGGEIGPSPAFDRDHLFFINQYSRLVCVDIRQHKLVWEYNQNLSDIPSPVAHQGYLIVPTSFGKVSCFNAQTGVVFWEHRFENGFHASPIICQDKVYLLDSTGMMRIFKLATTFVSLGQPTVAEACVATPAFVQQWIIIRGQTHLFCIGNSQP